MSCAASPLPQYMASVTTYPVSQKKLNIFFKLEIYLAAILCRVYNSIDTFNQMPLQKYQNSKLFTCIALVQFA